MCLLAFAYRYLDQRPLLVSANRDEFFNRPTQSLHRWPDAPVIAGRDAQEGGTWMGCSLSGRFAAVTNFRSGKMQPMPRSRGHLVSQFLNSTCAAMDWIKPVKNDMGEYGGFNLLLYDGTELIYANNQTREVSRLPPGLYALSNHLLDTPWPKVEHARAQLAQYLERTIPSCDDLLGLLASRQTCAPHLLPDTGISPEWEALLSAPFIVSEEYGTRASTAVIMTADGGVEIAEQSYLRGQSTGLETIRFNVPGGTVLPARDG